MCSHKQSNSDHSNMTISKLRENKVAIIYENDDLIIVDKPYDMYINSDDNNEKNTVAYHIASADSHRSTSDQPLHFVHRLDYATSGILCIAKTKRAAGDVGKLFQQRAVRKYYMAVVRNHLIYDAVDILYPVGELTRTDGTNHKMLAIRTADDEEQCRYVRTAETRLLVLERGSYDDSKATIVLLKPNTGRRHQLRAHCHSIGHTILGDYTYSDGADNTPHRMFLHANRLVFENDENLDIQTENPFTTDLEFMSKWKPNALRHRHEDREDFKTACQYIDNVTGLVTYKR